MRVVVVLALVATAVVGLPVKGVVRAQGMRQPSAAVSKPPFPLDNPEAIAEGAKRFSASCTGYCHGREGRVSRMLQPEEIWKIVAYIMSLSNAKDD